jgi:hypothetical protein
MSRERTLQLDALTVMVTERQMLAQQAEELGEEEDVCVEK